MIKVIFVTKASQAEFITEIEKLLNNSVVLEVNYISHYQAYVHIKEEESGKPKRRKSKATRSSVSKENNPRD